MYKVLITDEIPEEALDILSSSKKLEVVYNPNIPDDELKKQITDFHALVIRSRTKVTKEVIIMGKNLQVIARAGIGTDNIDVEEATKNGIYVINSPEGNITSAAEHTFALILSLARHIPQADNNVKNAKWKKGLPLGIELEGKTIGIIGAGKVGTKVANYALAFGMNIVIYDPYIKPEKFPKFRFVDLDTLLSIADIVSLHVPLTDTTRNLIGKRELKKMKKSALLINTSRGEVIDEVALYESLNENIIAGAALDVFRQEPLTNSELQKLPNIILTPHLGASTEEAQIKVATDIARKLIDFFDNGFISHAVNLPVLQNEEANNFTRVGQILGKILSQMMQNTLNNIQIKLYGEYDSSMSDLITRGVLTGILQQIYDYPVNIVNANYIAKKLDINISTYIEKNGNHLKKIEVSANFYNELAVVAGTVSDNKSVRILNINGFELDIKAEDTLLILTYKDMPGMIGKVGLILGKNNINIGKMEVSRKVRGGIAMLVLTVDDPINKNILNEIKESINPFSILLINLQ